ncbi:MAG TPA: UPF0179 family protein [Thermoplasmata archaeon]|nr:UPF0179 family protein [Thermoplasmata archaeon]HEV2428828.1 UPF0179 family protein [Thermoplasmata archaeon]
MTGITLIAKAQATEGFEFVYQGGAPICRTCPYRNACLTLDPGRRYRILRVRPIEHPCALQESSAHVVEVESVARPLLVDSRSAIVGSSVDVGRYACTRLDCPNWADCAGPTLAPKQRYRIERVPPEAAECRIGRTLKRVDAV